MKTTFTNENEIAICKPVYIGIDYHKRYSVHCVIDERGGVLERGRIEHQRAEEFGHLVKRWPGCRTVFESSMNWQWLYEVLEEEMEEERISLLRRPLPMQTSPWQEGQYRHPLCGPAHGAHQLATLDRETLV